MSVAKVIREKSPKELDELEKVVLIYDLGKRMGYDLPENVSMDKLVDLSNDFKNMFKKHHHKMNK